YLATASDPATLIPRLGEVKAPELRQMLREGVVRRLAAAPSGAQGGAAQAGLDAAVGSALATALAAADGVPRTEAAWIAGYAGAAAQPLAQAVTASVATGIARLAPARFAAHGTARAAET